jgi:AraC-like DNA-binding protein
LDALSDLLRVVRLDGAYFYGVDARAPWAVESVPATRLAPRILPEFEHLISYHVLVSGTCWGGLVGREPVRMEAGDVIVFPHGDAHRMSSAPTVRVGLDVQQAPQPFPFRVKLGGDRGETAEFVCGFLGCDRGPFNPLIAALPPQIHVRGTADGWIAAYAKRAAAEQTSGREGGALILTRLSELMFLEVVRGHLESLPSGESGWLAGLRDPVVGRAITLLHDAPAHPWSLPELARRTGASRSTLAERFAFYVGQPPMQYLARWRMQIAAGLLAQGGSKIAEVAGRVGYDSEAAFSRAFKKVTGAAPAAWRRGVTRSEARRSGPDAPP